MRKYRGLTKKGKWVYGWYLEKEDSHYNTYSVIVYGRHFEVIPETVGQSTGLKDKNGKDIDWWEGDLFKFYSDSLYEIKFIDGAFYFVSEKKKRLCNNVNWWVTLPKKVGNIHQNPKLIEGKDNE